MSSLGPGPKLLHAGGQDGYARIAVEIDTSRESAFELVVPAGTEVVLVGPRRHGETLVLAGEQGLPLYAGTWVPRITVLAPGSYTLSRSFGGREIEQIAFRVGTERTVVRWSAR